MSTTSPLGADSQTELLPCPFCGRQNKIYDFKDGAGNTLFSVNCGTLNCPARSSFAMGSAADVATTWNRRAALAAGAPVQQSQPEKMAPVQGYKAGIPWSLHLEAYDAYSKKWAPQPAMIDLEGRNCRGGFSAGELDGFIPGWRDKVSEIGRLKARIAELESAAQSSAPAPVSGEVVARPDLSRLYLAIMNLACKPDKGCPGGEQHAYKLGHRDARHAAAELALAALPAPQAPDTPRNFCSACGKPTPPGSIHTCTPPQAPDQTTGETK
jgi:hypothetical protein